MGVQEGITFVAELIGYFHDYIIILLVCIILFVSYGFYCVILNVYLDRYVVDSHVLELTWTVLPMVFLLFIALPSLYLLYSTEDFIEYNMCVKAVGHQWYWEYEYFSLNSVVFNSYILPYDDSTSAYRLLDVDNRLCIPFRINTIIVVTSADVLHSWAAPSLGVKVDAVPGRLNYLNILPISAGVFYGQCSELCGANHSFIPIVVEVCSVSSLISYIDSLK